MSGYTEKVLSDQHTLEQGAAFLQKPFSVATLASAIRKALETP